VKVLITGAEGFIGRNLRQRLVEMPDVEVVQLVRGQNALELPDFLKGVNFVFHLAGVNRTADLSEFENGNYNLTRMISEAVALECRDSGRQISMLFAGSIQAGTNTAYGRSKLAAEHAAIAASSSSGFPLHLFRLPNVFGKWARPQYNSVVATFCHNIARGMAIDIHDPDAMLSLVYIDDVIEQFLQVMNGIAPPQDEDGFATVNPKYSMTVGSLAKDITRMRDDRQVLRAGKVGSGFGRALYATYMSYLPIESCAYALPRHEDRRGAFVELLKTPESGQFSYFTAAPGITRGGHYHHSKIEKFLIVKGLARFRFVHVQSGERREVIVSSSLSEVVETLPGWAHDITNIGDEDLIVFLWANEEFDPDKPDTYAYTF
jgi:UDP-2-acetamido-2,6-beta-L-arabino-hexul-4-ose reductase